MCKLVYKTVRELHTCMHPVVIRSGLYAPRENARTNLRNVYKINRGLVKWLVKGLQQCITKKLATLCAVFLLVFL